MFSWEEGLKAIVAIAFLFVTFLHTGLFTGSSVSFPQLTQLCVVGSGQLAQIRLTFMSIGCLRAHIVMVMQ